MKPKEVKKRLEANGWVEQPGGKVQVPFHPGDLNPWTLKSIEQQSGVSMR